MKTFRNAFVLGVSTIVLTLFLPYLSAASALAQEEEQQRPDARSNEPGGGRADGDLISRLNLTPEQVRRIREIRQQNAVEMRDTRQRMMRAQRELDETIYADVVDEAAIETRARDLAAAQVAVSRLRALTELRIRRVLTPEQLNLLREFRQQARERDQENPRGRRQNPNAFQQRQRLNGVQPNPNDGRQQPSNSGSAKPSTTGKTPGDTPPANSKP